MQVRCSKGHLYEDTQYPTCPVCNGLIQSKSFSGGYTQPVQGYGSIAVTQDNKTTAPDSNFTDGRQSVTGAGDTMPPSGLGPKVTEIILTTPVPQKELGFLPIYGWIVCVKGPNVGKSYELQYEVTTIGRGGDAKVKIPNDSTISENAVEIDYVKAKKCFIIAKTKASSLPEVHKKDGSEIALIGSEPVILEIYDTVCIGESEFVFIPLCGKDFSWAKTEQPAM